MAKEPRPLTQAEFADLDWHTYVTVWSRHPGGVWVIERSWALGYLRDSGWQAPKREMRGREYAIFRKGEDPNAALAGAARGKRYARTKLLLRSADRRARRAGAR